MLRLYSYPQSSQYLIDSLGLASHPEGGHFAVTYLPKESVPSPYAKAKEDRLVQTTIYYLLSIGHDAPANDKDGPERIENHSSSIGVMHKNKSTVRFISMLYGDCDANHSIYLVDNASAPYRKSRVYTHLYDKASADQDYTCRGGSRAR